MLNCVQTSAPRNGTGSECGGGPARRNYELTAAGKARLQSWVQVIERRAEAMRRFVKSTKKLLDK